MGVVRADVRRLLTPLCGFLLLVGLSACQPDRRRVPDAIAVFVPGERSSAFKLRSLDGRLLTLRVGGSKGTPVAGDWDGDGRDGVGLFEPGSDSFLLTDDFGDELPQFSRIVRGWGCPACIPLAGDFTGTGKDGVGLYDAARGLFLLRDRAAAASPVRSVAFGQVGRPQFPVAGNFDGCERDQLGLYDPVSAMFHLRGCRDDDPPRSFQFGPPGNLPIAGRWNGGERDGVGVFDPASGHILLRFDAQEGASDRDLAFFRTPALPIAGRWRFDSP